jgi:hypothetical protein
LRTTIGPLEKEDEKRGMKQMVLLLLLRMVVQWETKSLPGENKTKGIEKQRMMLPVAL